MTRLEYQPLFWKMSPRGHTSELRNELRTTQLRISCLRRRQTKPQASKDFAASQATGPERAAEKKPIWSSISSA